MENTKNSLKSMKARKNQSESAVSMLTSKLSSREEA
jgi:hypothetical protein